MKTAPLPEFLRDVIQQAVHADRHQAQEIVRKTAETFCQLNMSDMPVPETHRKYVEEHVKAAVLSFGDAIASLIHDRPLPEVAVAVIDGDAVPGMTPGPRSQKEH